MNKLVLKLHNPAIGNVGLLQNHEHPLLRANQPGPRHPGVLASYNAATSIAWVTTTPSSASTSPPLTTKGPFPATPIIWRVTRVWQHTPRRLALWPWVREDSYSGAMNRVEIMKKDSEEDGQGDKVYAPTGEVYGLAWGHGGGLLAIASDEVFPIVFNFASAKAIKCRPGHTGKVLAVVFSPDDKFLCSTSADGNLNIYKFDSQLDPQLLSFHKISLTIDPIG